MLLYSTHTHSIQQRKFNVIVFYSHTQYNEENLMLLYSTHTHSIQRRKSNVIVFYSHTLNTTKKI